MYNVHTLWVRKSAKVYPIHTFQYMQDIYVPGRGYACIYAGK